MTRADASPRTVEIGVRGGAIAVETAGDGLPLVLLHGWALDRSVWEQQIGPLSASFRVIAIDRRGFGGSSAPPDLAGEVDDLVVVRKVLGLDRMAIVGMSQAGRVALQFALAHPDVVAALVLQGAPLDGFLPGPRREDSIPVSSYAALARGGELDRMKSLWRDHALMRVSTPDAGARRDALLARYEGRDLMARESEMPTAIAGRLEDVYAPTLVVTGERDTKWRQLVGDALAYGIPNARRAVIPGADHLCNLGDADAFNRLLEEFLRPMRERKAAACAG